jgi:dTDP-4-dehydrorhamnose reductase
VNRSKILIVGASSFVGGNLVDYLADKEMVFTTTRRKSLTDGILNNSCLLDIRRKEKCLDVIKSIEPEIVIHLAALTNLNQCFKDQILAWETNVIGAENIAVAASKIGAKVIYISTDLVFDGGKSFSSEGDIVYPICYYGKTKLEGEKRILAIHGMNLVLRTSLLYGWSRNESLCFTETIIDELSKGNKMKLFTDEIRTPLFINDLCSIIHLVEHRQDLSGIFHVGGPERTSRYEFGITIAEIFNLDKNLIIPVSLRDSRMSEDEKPEDCSLESTALRNKLSVEMTGLKEGLLWMKNRMGSTRIIN